MYHHHFALRDNPFAVTPDPRYLFPSDAHQEALAAITYGIEDRKGFVLVLGEVGTGKTTVVRRILDGLSSNTRAVYLFNVRLDFQELLRIVLRELGLTCASGDRLDMIDVLNDFLLQETIAGRAVVLVLDEAQHLAPDVLEELRMLTNLETAHEKLLQIVLVGQPELGRTLSMRSLRQLRQRIALVAELRPLTLSETRSYIEHRLAVAGGRGRTLFTARAVRRLHRVSGGIPRIINVVADKALMLGYGTHAKRITAKLVREAARDQACLDRGGFRSALRRVAVGLGVASAGIAVVGGAVAGFPHVRELGAQLLDAAIGVETPAPVVARAPVSAPPVPVAAATPVPVREVSTPPAPPAEPAVEVAALPALPPRPARPETEPVSAMQKRAPAKPTATATVQHGDTLHQLVQRVYGRADLTVLDLVKAANPIVTDIDMIVPGHTVSFPSLEPSAMVHRTRNGKYGVTLFTAPTATSADVDRVRTRAARAHLALELIPVRLARDLTAVRVVVEGFDDPLEAEAFHRATAPVGFEVARPGRSRS